MKLTRLLSASHGSRFRQNFLKVARANVFAMALPLLALPLLSRLFAPEDFGTLAIFAATLSLLLAFSTWRFDWVIPNARSLNVAGSLFTLGAAVLVAMCGLLAILIVFVDPGTPALALLAQMDGLVWLLPVALLGAGAKALFSGWFVRKGDLTAVSRATITQSVSNVGVSLGTGYLGMAALGLILAYVVASWAGIVTLVRNAGKTFRESLARVTRHSLVVAARRHGPNATWSTLVAVVNALSMNAPVLVLALFYLPYEIGWYALMHRMVSAPTGALSSALGQSFWSQASEHARARDIRAMKEIYRKTTLRLAIACIPVIAACLAAPLYIGPLLGMAEWGGAGYVLLAMTPLFVGSLMFSPTNHLVVLNQQHLQLIVDILRLALVVIAIVLADYMEFGFYTAVALASTASFIGHFTLFLVHTRMHRKYERR